MPIWRKILVISENHYDDQATIDRATVVARAHQAQLSVAIVEDPSHWKSGRAETRIEYDRMNQQGKRQLVKDLARSDQDGPPAQLHVLTGTPWKEIIQIVRSEGYDLIMYPNCVESGFVPTLRAGTVQHLIRQSPCPVWVDYPMQRQQPRCRQAAVDVMASSKRDQVLNWRIMRLAMRLAREEGRSLHVVQAWRLYGESMLRHGFIKQPEAEVDHLVEQMRDQHVYHLQQFVQQYDPNTAAARTHVVPGNPPEAIANLAKGLDIEVVVVGSSGRKGIAAFFDQPRRSAFFPRRSIVC